MSAKRPAIPEAVKRAVRQRCGYGCVICGRPIYAYEHMEGWANVARHVSSEITLLCDNHHRERTVGLLPIDVVREADRDPINRRSSASPAHPLHYSGDTCSATIGGCDFGAAKLANEQFLTPIVIDCLPLIMFRLEHGNLLLTLYAFDEDNSPVLIIRDNELRFSTEVWDIEFIARRMTIRQARRSVLLDVLFEVPDRVVVERGVFQFNGIRVEVNGGGFSVANTRSFFRNSVVIGAVAGIVLGEEEPAGLSGAWRMARCRRLPVPTRLSSDTITSNPRLEELIYFPSVMSWIDRTNEELRGVDVHLARHHWQNCRFFDCRIIVSADPKRFGLSGCLIGPGCMWVFVGAAESTLKHMQSVLATGSPLEASRVRDIFNAIRERTNPKPFAAQLGVSDQTRTEAFVTAEILSSLYHGLGPGGAKLVEGVFAKLEANAF